MKNVVGFLASNKGRLTRGVLGVIIGSIALISMEGIWSTSLLIIAGLLYIGALLDLCLLSVLIGPSAKGKTIRRQPASKAITYAILVLGILFGVFIGLRATHNETVKDKTIPVGQDVRINDQAVFSPSDIETNAAVQNKTNQNDLLLYLIEEEKLAHDVYTIMYQTHGVNVFANISRSETAHQDLVLSLLSTRGIADPRSSDIGIFRNQELQNLYNQLVDQGKQSVQEAYKVGVTIEEKDIADITLQLATATESDIIATLENLRRGSESHLRAFNRQLGRF